jgi:hypothetical protein
MASSLEQMLDDLDLSDGGYDGYDGDHRGEGDYYGDYIDPYERKVDYHKGETEEAARELTGRFDEMVWPMFFPNMPRPQYKIGGLPRRDTGRRFTKLGPSAARVLEFTRLIVEIHPTRPHWASRWSVDSALRIIRKPDWDSEEIGLDKAAEAAHARVCDWTYPLDLVARMYTRDPEKFIRKLKISLAARLRLARYTDRKFTAHLMRKKRAEAIQIEKSRRKAQKARRKLARRNAGKT